ncbi:hypothetical protein I317_05863 [Kwoniella heveanensis CBS 569]|nr:hypothetical protein I317_05863 [Kwoniella heveanensis CBS 569]
MSDNAMNDSADRDWYEAGSSAEEDDPDRVDPDVHHPIQIYVSQDKDRSHDDLGHMADDEVNEEGDHQCKVIASNEGSDDPVGKNLKATDRPQVGSNVSEEDCDSLQPQSEVHVAAGLIRPKFEHWELICPCSEEGLFLDRGSALRKDRLQIVGPDSAKSWAISDLNGRRKMSD